MPRRHQRMKYDPPGQRKRRRRRDPSLREDQVVLSRRTLLMKGGLIAAFGTMIGKLGYMQLLRGNVAKTTAKENVIKPEFIPAPRGLILDRKGRPLAQNRRAWELRVVPAALPNKKKEPARRQLVIDSLVSALQIEDTLVVQSAALPPESKDTVLSRVAHLLGYKGDAAANIVGIWGESVKKQIFLDVTPDGGLSIDDAARFRAYSAELPGVQVMNRLVYLIENTWNPSLPVTVAQDVPRDVALKLEANKMYLPGVILDDTALVRRYTGGEVMSHIIGYVKKIPAAMIDDPRWKGENGEKIYEQNDVIGVVGLEIALERELRGKRGGQEIERDAGGVFQRVIPGSRNDPEPGRNVQLTIDLELQEAVGKSLQKWIQKAAEGKQKQNEKRVEEGKQEWQIPNSGACVVYDPRNGEVLAMVSYPYYDNQLMATGISQRKWKEYTADNGPKAFLNRATSELYPAGSTLKVFIAASALHHGTLSLESSYTCRGCIFIPTAGNLADGRKAACWVGWNPNSVEGHGALDVYSAIEQSCDVFFYNAAVEKTQSSADFEPVYYWDYQLLEGRIYDTEDKHYFNGLGIEPLHEDLTRKFMFGSATGIEIDESEGRVPNPEWKAEVLDGEGWGPGDTINFSIGQGDFTCTPLQMTQNIGALAMFGKMQTPTLVLKTEEGSLSGTPQATPISVATPAVDRTAVERTPISTFDMKSDAFDIVREGMKRVVHSEYGTANNAAGKTKWPNTNPAGEEEILIAGKTGTAEYGKEDKIGARDSHAWFTCYAPLEHPEVAISVIIEKGGEGSSWAVPVADEVLRAYLELTGKRKRGKILPKNPKPI